MVRITMNIFIFGKIHSLN